MAKGWFTGKSLGTYIGTGAGKLAEFREARRIINGTDKADLIAGLAVQFQEALVAGGWA
jgi:putative chitinase